MESAGAGRPRRRSRTVKIIVLCILGILVIEPFFMYRKLVQQREMRAEARTPPSELVRSDASTSSPQPAAF